MRKNCFDPFCTLVLNSAAFRTVAQLISAHASRTTVVWDRCLCSAIEKGSLKWWPLSTQQQFVHKNSRSRGAIFAPVRVCDCTQWYDHTCTGANDAWTLTQNSSGAISDQCVLVVCIRAMWPALCLGRETVVDALGRFASALRAVFASTLIGIALSTLERKHFGREIGKATMWYYGLLTVLLVRTAIACQGECWCLMEVE